MNLHLNKEEFEELINLTSQYLQIPPSAVRKDYFKIILLPKFHVVFQSASKFAIPYVLRGIQVVTCAF